MIEKERLEEIGKRAKHRVLENSRGEVRYRFTEINTEDFDWLIEQAGIGINTSRDKHALIKSNIALNKRVQELENHIDHLYDNNVHLKGDYRLQEQNKRYREALEKIKSNVKICGNEEYFPKVVEEIVNEALEGEK